MKCSHCGKNNFDWVRRCDHCGRTVGAQSVTGPSSNEFLEYSTNPQTTAPDLPPPPVDANVLRLDSVQFDECGASEMDRRRALVFVPRSEIVQIELAHSKRVGNPWTVGIIGCIVLCLSLGLPVLSLIVSHGVILIQVWYLVAFAFPAVWMINLAVEKHWVVVIHSPKNRRHLAFANPPEPELMHDFLKSVQVRFGYSYTLDGGPAGDDELKQLVRAAGPSARNTSRAASLRRSTWRWAGLSVAAIAVSSFAWAMYRDRGPVPITATYDSDAYCDKLIWMEGRAFYNGKGTAYELYDPKHNGMVVQMMAAQIPPNTDEFLRVHGMLQCGKVGRGTIFRLVEDQRMRLSP